ncbi:TPA: hypothetical protein P0E36_004895 [Vibrio harveyi]|nr:hypothetical protein [Vibrio harveyi]
MNSQITVVQAVNKNLVSIMEEFWNAHYEPHSPERVSRFNNLCKELEDRIFLVPHTKRALAAIRRAKNACFWEDALSHLAQAEKETR